MKRFFIIASMAVLAVGCQKTEIQNEVQNQIGFSTETGKMTRAIVNDTQYPTTQSFAVYAYGWQNGTANTAPVMNNVEIAQSTRTINEQRTTVWAANDEITYYWPNDPRTTLNFYAYSPSVGTANTPAHQKLNGTIAHSETSGLSITNYAHDNMYVDFMTATPVVGAIYSATDPNGLVSNEIAGTVPVVFNHQMTQVIFNVTTDKAYPGVTFTVEEITLKNIHNVGNYLNANMVPSYHEPAPNSFKHGNWSNTSVVATGTRGVYNIFPADTDNGAIFADNRATVANDETLEAPISLTNAEDAQTFASMLTTGVTMIPQNMVKATSQVTAGTDSYAGETAGQMFMIKYSISGTGVAEETVVKHVPFRTSDAEVTNWGPNQKITYTVKIGLNEIYFEPSVADWTSTEGETYNFQQ